MSKGGELMKLRYLMMMPLIALGGCMSMRDATVTLPYTASSLAETPYTLKLGAFTRTLPAEILPNQYETTGYAFGKQISLTEPLTDYLRTAVAQEVRRGGAALRGDPACTIDARISKMALQYNAGSKLTFSGDVAYTVRGNGGQTVTVESTNSNQVKIDSVEAGHSQFMTGLVDGLLKSDSFLTFARANCPKA